MSEAGPAEVTLDLLWRVRRETPYSGTMIVFMPSEPDAVVAWAAAEMGCRIVVTDRAERLYVMSRVGDVG